jgi:hypothetical protein
MFMDESDMVGDVLSQHECDSLLVVRKNPEGMYRYEFEGPRMPSGMFDSLNLSGNCAGMKSGSYIDFGGTATKRVTITVNGGQLYGYVEVGEE